MFIWHTYYWIILILCSRPQNLMICLQLMHFCGVFLNISWYRMINIFIYMLYFMPIILDCRCTNANTFQAFQVPVKMSFSTNTSRSQQMEKHQTEMLNVAFNNNIFTGALHIYFVGKDNMCLSLRGQYTVADYSSTVTEINLRTTLTRCRLSEYILAV